MPTIAEVRAKYPQYSDMPDDKLAQALHAKYYSDMPYQEFAGKIGLTAPLADTNFETAIDTAAGLGKGVGDVALGAQHYLGKYADAIGADTVGQWLQKDAAQGRKKLAGEVAPHKARSPIAAGAGEIGGNVLATAPVGFGFAKGVQALPWLSKAVPNLAPALRSGGFRVAQTATTPMGKVGNALIRTGAGGVVGGTSAGLVNPEDAGTGFVLGAAMPGTFKVAGEAGKAVSSKVIKPAARRLMQSAIKPTLQQLKTGDAKVAIDTMLEYGINPSQRGVEKLRFLVDDINNSIRDKVANSTATVNRNDVLGYLGNVRSKFANQVSPTTDLNAIGGVADDFLHHPGIAGNNIPVQQAQQLKTGTYKALAGKYGEAGSAATEAQKALARGLKDKIADVVPGIGALNAEEAKLLRTLSVADRRALMEMNKNPVGLSILAGNKAAFAAFMADRSAAFKALAARMVNQAAKAPALIDPLADKFSNPLLRNAGLLSIESNP